MADKKMKKRWKLENEIKNFVPYEAGDDRTHKQVILSLEHILQKYKVWPNDRHNEEAKKLKSKKSQLKENAISKIHNEDGDEISPVEPINEINEVK